MTELNLNKTAAEEWSFYFYLWHMFTIDCIQWEVVPRVCEAVKHGDPIGNLT